MELEWKLVLAPQNEEQKSMALQPQAVPGYLEMARSLEEARGWTRMASAPKSMEQKSKALALQVVFLDGSKPEVHSLWELEVHSFRKLEVRMALAPKSMEQTREYTLLETPREKPKKRPNACKKLS